MARKPEAQFVNSIHDKLRRDVHREGMANPYRGGTADTWYDGSGGDLWIEYKWSPSLPREVALIDLTKKPHLSKLQQRWLRDRVFNGRNVAVVLGVKNHGALIFLNRTWEYRYLRDEITPMFVTREEVALFIETYTCLEYRSVQWQKNMSSLLRFEEPKT